MHYFAVGDLPRRAVAFAHRLIAMLSCSRVCGSAFTGGGKTRLRASLVAGSAAGDVGGQTDFRADDGRRRFSVE